MANPTRFMLCLLLGAGVAGPACAATLCVNPGGTSGCYSSIQSAINAASSGDTVDVAAGTYVEEITLKAGVDVVGESADTTTIQGTGAASPTNLSVVRGSTGTITTATLLQGFTIKDGNLNVSTTSSWGGGILLNNGASPTIRYNIITGNKAFSGGGIMVFNGCNPVIEGNVIDSNTATSGGGINMVGASPTIKDNRISRNVAGAPGAGFGGGILMTNGSNPTVTGNVIADNQTGKDGGGMVVQGNCSPTIRGNTISGNRTLGTTPSGIGGGVKFYDGGNGVFERNFVMENHANTSAGGIIIERNSSPLINANHIVGNIAERYAGGLEALDGSNPIITNNYIANNESGLNGGGVYIHTISPKVVNNTIVGHTVGPGQGIYCFDATPVIYNNIITGNTVGIESDRKPFAGTFDYNDVWGNPIAYLRVNPGAHDLAVDPQFLDPANLNFYPKTGSLCIDAGTATNAPTTDIDGLSRPVGPKHDMGAHEYRNPARNLKSYVADVRN